MLKLLTGLSELLYEVMIYFVLIPKTLVQVVFKPKWIHQYLQAELKKESPQRFNDYSEPLIFLVVLGVLPLLRVMNFVGGYGLKGELSGSIADFLSFGFEVRIFWIFIFIVSWPLAASLVVLWWKGDSVTRDSLRPLFWAQAYCFGAYYIISYLALPALLQMFVLRRNPDWEFLLLSKVAWLSNLWLPYCQIRIIREQLSIGVLKAIRVLLVCCIFSLLLMFVFVAFLVIGMTYGASWSSSKTP
jgi:hypothetical protein